MNFVVSCAVLLHLSMGTLLEVRPVFPQIANYCMAHPTAKLIVKVTPTT